MKPPQKNQVICGSNLEVVKSWPPNCISAICTDPPYGLEFMGKDWDKGLPGIRFWREFLRITKPGGFLLCFGGTRTYHRLACAIEDAGWEIRDCMMWLYGSGFPKSHNISKAIDKSKGVEREKLGVAPTSRPNTDVDNQVLNWGGHGHEKEHYITTSATPLAQLWDGYGTALKPAWEPIIVAMKPLDGTFARNAEAHGVAGLNIDGGRIEAQDQSNLEKNWDRTQSKAAEEGRNAMHGGLKAIDLSDRKPQGRWPANLILDEEAGAMLDKQTQNVGDTKPHKVKSNKEKYEGYGSITHKSGEVVNYNEPNAKGASRFFYCAKTSRKERNMGMENQKNSHPTVKPLALMKYLCTLLKMPSAGQVILDPFLGSGTTGIACKELGINFIGIEKEPEYCEIAIKRIAAVPGQEITLHTDNSPTEEPKAIPCHDENRQRIINTACAALRRNQK